MPVRKLRRIEDATIPAAAALDERNLRSGVELSELCLRLRPLTPPRGVRRFSSIEDAQEHRRRWEIEALQS